MELNDTSTTLGLAPNKKMYGRVGCVLKDKDGNILQSNVVSNNIVKGIRKPILRLLAGRYAQVEDLPFVRQLKLGTSNTPPTVQDERLGALLPGSEKLMGAAPTIAEDGLSVTFSFLYEMNDSHVDNKTVREMGLYTADGTMIARTVVGSWTKSPGVYFEVYWTIGYTD